MRSLLKNPLLVNQDSIVYYDTHNIVNKEPNISSLSNLSVLP